MKGVGGLSMMYSIPRTGSSQEMRPKRIMIWLAEDSGQVADHRSQTLLEASADFVPCPGTCGKASGSISRSYRFDVLPGI